MASIRALSFPWNLFRCAPRGFAKCTAGTSADSPAPRWRAPRPPPRAYRSGSEASRASPSPACSPRRGSAAMRRGAGGGGTGGGVEDERVRVRSRELADRSLGSRAGGGGGAGARAGETARGGVEARTCPSVLRTTCAYTARLLKNTFRWCNRSPTAMARVAIARAREEVGGASGTRARAARRGIAAGHRVGHARRDCRAARFPQAEFSVLVVVARILEFRFSALRGT